MPLTDRLVDERQAALAHCASDLHHALQFLRSARAISATFALGIELPPERPLIDAIHACAHAREKEKT